MRWEMEVGGRGGRLNGRARQKGDTKLTLMLARSESWGPDWEQR